ncbi:hypothetical protein BDAP_000221 [Binucleata daphniae]
MKYVALISGGKDSIYSICKLEKEGYTLVGLLYLENESKNIDSFMYQSVGGELINAYEKCLGVKLYKHKTASNSYNQDLEYKATENDEVEDLYSGLLKIKKDIQFDAVSSGAILSTYQKNRVQNVCDRLGLISLTPLWSRDQKELLDEMINAGIEARIVKIATGGFDKSCVGYTLVEIRDKINKLKDKNKPFYFNYCGEGGEYETMVYNAPVFSSQIVIEEYEVLRHPDEQEKEWNVYFMKILKYACNDTK